MGSGKGSSKRIKAEANENNYLPASILTEEDISKFNKLYQEWFFYSTEYFQDIPEVNTISNIFVEGDREKYGSDLYKIDYPSTAHKYVFSDAEKDKLINGYLSKYVDTTSSEELADFLYDNRIIVAQMTEVELANLLKKDTEGNEDRNPAKLRVPVPSYFFIDKLRKNYPNLELWKEGNHFIKSLSKVAYWQPAHRYRNWSGVRTPNNPNQGIPKLDLSGHPDNVDSMWDISK